MRHYHARSGRSCAVAANLAGLSASYLYDILHDRRWRVRWHGLRALCEEAWQTTDTEGRDLLWLRCGADADFKPRAYLTREFLWRVAAHTHTQSIASDIGMDVSYVNRILSGRQRPTAEVLMALYTYVSLDSAQAAHLYATDVQRTFKPTA